MPIAELHVLKGYTPEEKERLGQALTDAIAPEWPASSSMADHRWMTRHRQAYMDYTVALNCVYALAVEEPDRPAVPPGRGRD